MHNTPEPRGVCVLDYKNNVLQYTKDDDTSAGYEWENTKIKVARDAATKNLSDNHLTD